MSGIKQGFRRTAIGVLILAAPLAGAACDKSPRTTSVAISAVLLDGGQPTGVFNSCEPGGVLLIEVWDDTNRDRGRGTSAGWQVSVPTGGGPGVERARLLSTPDGWVLQPSAVQLIAFEHGVSYWLHSEGHQPRNKATQIDTGVRFTLGDLTGLGAGQVWAGTRDGDEDRRMTLDEFATTARDSCR